MLGSLFSSSYSEILSVSPFTTPLANPAFTGTSLVCGAPKSRFFHFFVTLGLAEELQGKPRRSHGAMIK